MFFQVSLEKTSDGNVSSELSLNVVGWEDEGTYTCSARETSPGAENTSPTKQQIKLEIYGNFLLSYVSCYLFHKLSLIMLCTRFSSIEECQFQKWRRKGNQIENTFVGNFYFFLNLNFFMKRSAVLVSFSARLLVGPLQL